MNIDEIKALESDHEVCLCMDVSLKEIIDSVEAGAKSVEDIMDATDAGTACELCQSCSIDEGEEREVHLDEILAIYAK